MLGEVTYHHIITFAIGGQSVNLCWYCYPHFMVFLMDVYCDICINILICENDNHNLEFDLIYCCVNHIGEICVKDDNSLEYGYVASGFLLPVNIDARFVSKFLRKDYQLLIYILNVWYIGIWFI